MLALLVNGFGPPEAMVLREIDTPQPAAGQVRITVHAAGVNFADTLMIAGQYQQKPPLPFAAGMEVSGVVSALGADVDGWRVGDRVMALCLLGGFAQEVCVDRKFVFRVADGVSLDTAAAFPIAYGSAFHALVDRGRMRLNEWLLVFGAGSGVGLAAVELGALLGARVIAVAGSDGKLQAARERGALFTFNHGSGSVKEYVRALTGGRGFDLCFDPVGGGLFDEALRCIAPAGRLLVVGFASGRVPAPPANLLLLRRCDVVGVYTIMAMGEAPELYRERFDTMMRWTAAGLLRPLVSRTFELAQVPQALAAIAGRSVAGRVIVRIPA